MPLVSTRGAASAQGFGEFAQVTAVNYIEDVFSCFLYTGTGAAQTITNNIDLSTKGGLTWIKGRSDATDHALYDTARGATFDIASNLTTAQTTEATGLTAFGTTGFSIGALAKLNTNAATYVSWTFRKQPKFFDVVTYTGTGSNTTIAHNLGSVPGSIIVKRTDTTANWAVYHRSLANTQYLVLNSYPGAATGTTWWNSTTPTSAVFSLGTDASVNASGGTYVAYIYAHDAGGFGLTGSDNVISCGSYTGDGTNGQSISLGYEPQWLLIKRTDTSASWFLQDNMRPFSVTATEWLQPNTANAESAGGVAYVSPTATGFTFTSGGSSAYNASGGTYIYIAIRRGPMKVPTDGTKVFAPVNQTGGGTVTTNFPVDLLISTTPSQSAYRSVNDRLRGASTTSDVALYTNVTDAEAVGTGYGFGFDNNTGFKDANYSNSFTDVYWNFRRAPGFFDEVCYTGTGADPQTVSHNLGVAPELMIFKARDVAAGWRVWGGNMAITSYLALSENSAVVTGSTFFGSTLPTSTSFYVGSGLSVSARTIVAYLFASCPGVSKVGSYTGTGTTQTINCGFTAGARFVMIKRTDSTGDWYVWDSARGIVAGNDSYLLLNSTAAEVTSTDYIDTYSAGFEITSTAPAAINASGGTYIFLAIA